MRSNLATLALATFAAGVPALAAAPPRVPIVAAITVDGDPSEWKGVPVTYLEDGPRVTAVATDGAYLYIHFQYGDTTLERRVLGRGMTVWVNLDGKHKATYGLRYRGTVEARDALRSMEGESDRPPNADGARGKEGGPPAGEHGRWQGGPAPVERAPLGALEVIRDDAVEELIGSGARENGPAAACRVVDGAFSYELRVPLAEAGAGQTAAKAGKIAVGFQVGALTESEREAFKEARAERGGRGGEGGEGPRGGFGGRPGGAGGMGGPGGARGMGGPGPGRERTMTAASEPVWLDFLLDVGGSKK